MISFTDSIIVQELRVVRLATDTIPPPANIGKSSTCHRERRKNGTDVGGYWTNSIDNKKCLLFYVFVFHNG